MEQGSEYGMNQRILTIRARLGKAHTKPALAVAALVLRGATRCRCEADVCLRMVMPAPAAREAKPSPSEVAAMTRPLQPANPGGRELGQQKRNGHG